MTTLDHSFCIEAITRALNRLDLVASERDTWRKRALQNEEAYAMAIRGVLQYADRLPDPVVATLRAALGGFRK